MPPKSPRLARHFLERLLPTADREFVIGDLEETFAAQVANGKPVRAARRWYWRTALGIVLSARPVVLVTTDDGARVHRGDRGTARIERVRGDLTSAWRGLTREPGYTALLAATLAIGIGASTVMFAVADWSVLRPIAGAEDPGRLVTVWAQIPMGLSPIGEAERMELQAQSPSLEGLAGYWTTPVHVVAPKSREAARLEAQIVSGNFFDVLGRRSVARGRGFTPDEGRNPGQAGVIVISDRMWRRDFGGDTAALGTSVVINGKPVAVIGVATAGFHGVQRSENADLWIPIAAHGLVVPLRSGDLVSGRRNTLYYALLGRLRPGATTEAAEAELAVVRRRISDSDPTWQRMQQVRFVADPAFAASPLPLVRGRVTESVALMFGASVLLLMLTCANAGGLMLIRAMTRRSEVAIRLALGATRGMILRQWLVESLLLSAAGALLAVVAGQWALSALRGTVIYPSLPPLGDLRIDGRVLAFAVGIAALATMAASILPALSGSRTDLRALDVSSRATLGRRHRVARRVLAVAQTALSLVLLLAAVLLLRSLWEQRRLDPGFNGTTLLAFSIDPGLQGYATAERASFYRSLVERVRETTGVERAAIASFRPLHVALSRPTIRPADRPEMEAVTAHWNAIGAGFFGTLGVPIVDGREFTESDFTPERNPVIVSEALARKLFDTTRAAGRYVLVDAGKRTAEVVGVVPDVRYRSLRDPWPFQMYSPFGQGQTGAPSSASVLVRTSASPHLAMPHLREVVRQLDATSPIVEMLTYAEMIDLHLAEPVLLGRLSGLFALLATLLAGLGVYGLFGRMIVERRPEFAIRLALGATPGRVLRMVLVDGVRLSLAAIAIGFLAASWLMRVIRERLFGVDPLDVVSFVVAGAAVLIVALLAVTLPARRAARIDPTTALRE